MAAYRKPRVVLVHGIHTREGASNVGRLAPYFERAGFEVKVFEYGWLGVLQARFRNPGIARRLAALVRRDDHLVCHSNGATVAWLAMRRHGMTCQRVSLVAPALDDDKLMQNAAHTDVYFNGCDDVLWLARLFWHHAWGSMGRDGCSNPLRRIFDTVNIDVAHHPELPQICGHLDYFAEHILPRFAPWLVNRHVEYHDHAF
jgi:hypothetical protein